MGDLRLKQLNELWDNTVAILPVGAEIQRGDSPFTPLEKELVVLIQLGFPMKDYKAETVLCMDADGNSLTVRNTKVSVVKSESEIIADFLKDYAQKHSARVTV